MSGIIPQGFRETLAIGESGFIPFPVMWGLDLSPTDNLDEVKEDLIDGQTVQPNRMANTAYKQYMVDYMLDHQDDMSIEQAERVLRYIRSLDEVVTRNSQREAREQAQKELSEQATAGGPGATRGRQPGPSQPFQDTIQQNVNT